MKWTGLNELREKYLSFFESKGHLRIDSFSLIPRDDNSLLLINSGMAPMKKYFTGEVTPPRRRVTTCQKCIRTPDIERVGITARHGTYFEMLGNFSFGDYFKHEATAWAWEFCTKVLDMPVERIWVSIYQDDDESFNVWTKEVGVDASHIVRLGKEDNFWEHGAGPCGPCSELYFDRGEKYGCGSPTCGVGCDCDRYVEFWNLVFTQFENDGNNNYSKLAKPNIDTGMGLERLACIMQGVDNLFLVDTVQNIMKHICRIANVEYGKDDKTDISLRVITDHIRSTTFMISDGVMPSNEGRGYVLRRLLRRAARHGRLLAINHPFLSEVCDTVIKENESAYPELAQKRDFIKKLISVEEESFAKTIDQGLEILNSIIENSNSNILSGEDAFKLNDTFGFPLDLTKEIIAEKNMTVDEDTFNKLLKQQKERARAARKNAGADAWISDGIDFGSIPKTEFLGYEADSCNAKVLAIVKDGNIVASANAGDKVGIILDKTTFYAEGGGQVGDTGKINSDTAIIDVINTTKDASGLFIHSAVVESGYISCEDSVKASIDIKRRKAIMRNHTAAHLLQAALRKVLGTHVEQAGQLVNEEHVRFDFTHFSPMSKTEIESVESIINEQILNSLNVVVKEMPIDEAKKLGAMALFGEKYGNTVRVVNIDGFSIELCGGTHIDNTSKLGLFKIKSEGSVAAGVRRIEAVTGYGVLNMIDNYSKTINDCCYELKLSNPTDIVKKCISINSEIKDKDKQISKLNQTIATMRMNSIINSAVEIDGIKIVSAKLEDTDAASARIISDKIKDKFENAVSVIVAVKDNKISIASSVGKIAQSKGAHAGNIVKAISQIAGGNGGGRPDSAMAGAKDISKIDLALDSVKQVVLQLINNAN